jgi:hypothetical protein
LLERQRQQDETHADRQQDDREAPAVHDPVEEEEDLVQRVDQRLEDVREDDGHQEIVQALGAVGRRAVNMRWSWTGS